jgi:hypothetical protein
MDYKNWPEIKTYTQGSVNSQTRRVSLQRLFSEFERFTLTSTCMIQTLYQVLLSQREFELFL